MKILRIFFGILGAFCIVWTIIFGSSCIMKKQKILTKAEYKCILTVWHVDTFEGGEGSRKQYLLKVSREFEESNEGVLVSVIDYTPTAVKEQINKGIYPDLISFGNGVEIKNQREITNSISFKAGEINGRQYAIPWCRGGYLLITKSSEKINLSNQQIDRLIVSQSEYTLPLGALMLENVCASDMTVKSPLDAYVDFVSSKETVLLGTQRDVVRLRNRGIEIKTRPLTSFCDLYQYVAITTMNKDKIELCEKFVNILLSQDSQKNLKNISMFSINYDLDFSNEHLNLMQTVNPKKTVSPFLDTNALKNLQELSYSAVKGDKNAEIKFKNLLV